MRAQEREFNLRGYVGYGYNYTWGSYADFEALTRCRFNPYFELDAGVQLLTSNVYTLSADVRPLFPLPVGEMYIDTRLNYRIVARNRIHDVAVALSVGYRMDYVDVRLGAFTRFINEFGRKWSSENEIVGEPISMVYSVKAYVRPYKSSWNLSFRIANFDDFQIERVWQPLFTIGGQYSFVKLKDLPLCLVADVEIKPTGIFHLDASFYGATARVGVNYKFR